jgi:hypothetical protein
MNNTPNNNPRPMAVKLALILLALDCGVALVIDVVNFQLSYRKPFIEATGMSWAMLGSWLMEDILFFVLLWCVFRGKNWARWVVAVWIVLSEICISPLVWVRDHQMFSTLEAVWFWVSWLLDIIGVIALFHSSSNRWFREHKLQAKRTSEPK